MTEAASSARLLGILRATIGLLQGLALYLIYLAYDDKTWPATDGLVFAPLMLVTLFVPLLVLQAVGNIRIRTLTIWTAAATIIVAFLGFYDIWHAWPVDWSNAAPTPHILPSPQLYLALLAGLFIAQSLIAGGDVDRKFIANYGTHFDVTWKLAVQLALATAFTGAFWGLLWLGAGLFNLIKIDFVTKLLEHRWFAIPATTLAYAVAIHVTDVRAGIVRGIRTLGLALLSWLLPLMTLIASGFLIALAFTGVQALWDTRFATGLLLIAVGALVVLINAAYGDTEREVPRALTYPGSLAALLLMPLVGLSAYALVLRVDQYGWTADRIYVSACVLVAVCYAIGYALAALWRGPWLKRIERWNFYTALLILAALLGLFTPIADPYRISVADQVLRLESGALVPENFDFSNLRWSGGRYGKTALETLKAKSDGPHAAFVREAADTALQESNRYARITVAPNASFIAKNVIIHTPDGQLPATFMAKDWQASGFRYRMPPGCLTGSMVKCDAVMADIDDDGTDEIVIIEPNLATVFKSDTTEKWKIAGYWNLPVRCSNIHNALRDGQFKLVLPESSPWRDVEIAGVRLRFAPEELPQECPK